MLWSGSSPMTVVRDGMWGFLLFSGVAWLAVAWSVLRLEPAGKLHDRTAPRRYPDPLLQ